MHLSDAPIIELDTVDSTNNYAMRLIDADKAQPGLTITAKRQEQGKGQRGKSWADAHGESLLMSVVVKPEMEIKDQFLFSISITLAIANVLQKLHDGWQLKIKWPNDIIINDKKAGGILIENVLRGSKWTHSIIGLGLNVNQPTMPHALPNATSLAIAAGEAFDIYAIQEQLRTRILANTVIPPPAKILLKDFNALLYKGNMRQRFSDGQRSWEATLLGVKEDGKLEVILEDGTVTSYIHGQVIWVWD
jgi:BirA family biotin operon repressor/biotin-[acetyl-CoA-carboxylase] ligase